MASTPTVQIESLITSAPEVYGGRPCLAGTRYPILELAVHYKAGEPAEQIAADYGLPLADVYAGIAYYLANRAAIDAELSREQESYEAARAERAGHHVVSVA
jgi:uncharacterized protein (DUF433 family)